MTARNGRTDLLSLEMLIISFVVWLRSGWDAALLTAVGLVLLFVSLARLGEEATNIISGAIGCVWGAAALFVLIHSHASMVTSLIFTVAAAVIGFSVHFVAFERSRRSAAS